MHAPRVPREEQEGIREWHDRAYAAMRSRDTLEIDCAGTRLVVPRDVFAPVEPFLLANAVAAETLSTDRVLDVGTGSGINAIIAAGRSTEVVAVDNNPLAVECARLNARRNGVSDRITVLERDLFQSVDGRFDLVVFDPPFRWFQPRDQLETAITDENYRSLTRFMTAVRGYLRDDGRVLIHFGTSADLPYLHELIAAEGFSKDVVSEADLVGEWSVSCFVFRLTAAHHRYHDP